MYAATKDLTISSILQWPSASQLTGSHNKTGIVDRIAMKFAVNIPHIIRSLCSKFGDISFIFKEVTTKRSWTQVRGPEFDRRQSLI